VGAGLYVHFPFCRAKCPYCHFASVPFEPALGRLWRDGLEGEAALRADPTLAPDTLYIGGGTPSLLEPDEIAGLVATLVARFGLSPAELTLEAGPDPSAAARLGGWREAGVTRLSVGVQSFDDAVLGTLGRRHTADEAEAFCAAALRAGFGSVGFDLMIGVPGETRSSVDRTLERALRLGPDHVSLYILENVEGLPFEKVMADRPVDEDEVADRHQRATAELEAAGLARYEISNFARPGKECLHNLKYWRYEPFLGLGPSACSRVGSRRWCNQDGLEAWGTALRLGRDPIAEIRELAPEEACREALVFGLRLVQGVDVVELEERLGTDARRVFGREIGGLVSEGLLVQDGARLRIPADKLLVSNAILSRFLS